jgi:hypothetical protein
MFGTTTASGATFKGREIFQADHEEFRRCFGSSAFALRHALADDHLFSLPRLAKAAERCADRFFSAGGMTRTDGTFSEMRRKQLVGAAITELDGLSSWAKISSIADADREYLDIQNSLLLEIQRLSGRPILRDMTWAGMTVFLASPNIVTPYHIDNELNFLCQIAGEKDVCLFDPHDRELLPDEEIERFYFGDQTGLRYPEHLQVRGRVYRLSPGVAVHHPPLAAHWVKNGPQVSVSVSIAFSTRQIDKRGRIYQVNYCLRRMGLKPRPPGRSSGVDSVKARLMGLLCKRNPKTHLEVVFSAPERLKAPLRAAKRLLFTNSGT